MTGELRVVATAGHVDHGKSSLIERLTGMDPDRWDEEKRRGLTIDLGYAWCTLSSGREIGFVDVPGHERFIANMLAGVGPVRLVLFVVAADEGWKRQSEEHLQIVDVLGVEGGVVALTKRDLVDDETAALAEQEVRERLAGTALVDAPVIPVSSTTGEGVEELRRTIDGMIGRADPPAPARTRLFVDRVFSITGAGTVVTGTLSGDCLEVGDEVEISGGDGRARIRSLQTHRRAEDRACPVSRVAVNLVGAERERLERGAVLTAPGAFRATTTFDALLRPVRGISHPITARGAFKLYAGAAEVDVRIRLLGATRLEPGGEAFVRLKTSEAVTLDVFDRFVLRESGRRETVGGGVVLDPAPPARPGPEAGTRLRARVRATRDQLPALLAEERGAVRAEEARILTGSDAQPSRVDGWFVRVDATDLAERAIIERLDGFHRDHPMEEGLDLATARGALRDALRPSGIRVEPELADALLNRLVENGAIDRTSAAIRAPGHRSTLVPGSSELERLLAAIGGERETSPPSITELVAAGNPREVIDAAIRNGAVTRVSPDLIFAPGLVARAEGIVRSAGAGGITVSAFREALATSRKYALPLLEWFDLRGVTRRDGDRRFPRDVGSG